MVRQSVIRSEGLKARHGLPLGNAKRIRATVLPIRTEALVPVLPALTCRLTETEWESLNARLQLTTRELEIASGVLLGQSEPAIAVALGISTNTVHTHLGRIYRKLGVHSAAGLILRIFAEYLESTRTVSV